MKHRIMASASALAIVVTGLTFVPAHAASGPPVVRISAQGDQVVVSQATMRPGVVEFRVGPTFVVPGPDGGPDQLAVVRTDQLPLVLESLQTVFADPEAPGAAAAAAQGMRTINGAATFYGGGGKGTQLQVALPAGNYSVVGIPSAVFGLTKPATFTVAGEPRAGALPATQATVRAIGPVGDNRWTFRQSGAPVRWLRFANASKEIHFLDMAGVKAGTTSADVRKAFTRPGEPKFFTGEGLVVEVISPGVVVAVKARVAPGGYLLTCFVPSESDGMPHALMGMWKLVSVR
jgi:hypothetical protein